jgi:hypothetical protein
MPASSKLASLISRICGFPLKPNPWLTNALI